MALSRLLESPSLFFIMKIFKIQNRSFILNIFLNLIDRAQTIAHSSNTIL